jgi:hypothetical protein
MALEKDTMWDAMLKLRAWTPLSRTGYATTPLSENVKKVGEQKYLFAVESDLAGNDDESPYVTMIMWAESDGAVLQAADGVLEENVNLSEDSAPASVLLPLGCVPEYGAILKALRMSGENVIETAEYRIAIDGAFLHKVIRGDRGSYYFRRNDIVESERPFAIAYRLG